MSAAAAAMPDAAAISRLRLRRAELSLAVVRLIVTFPPDQGNQACS
jgi:hypothetical protein